MTPTPAPTLPPAVSAVRDLPIGWVAGFLPDRRFGDLIHAVEEI